MGGYRYKDPSGCREVGVKVRHLRTGWRGEVREVHDDGYVTVYFTARKMPSRVPCRLLETLLEQQRRNQARWRRRGGSVTIDERDPAQDRPWTTEDERYLRTADEADVSLKDQAVELERTVVAVQWRRSRLGIQDHGHPGGSARLFHRDPTRVLGSTIES